MKNHFLLIFFTLLFSSAFAQSFKPIPQKVFDYHTANVAFDTKALITDASLYVPNAAKQEDAVLDQATTFNLNPALTSALLEEAPSTIEIAIPQAGQKAIRLELIKKSIFSSNFEAINAKTGESIDFDRGVTYQGIIQDDYNSLAVITVFQQEITGFIASSTGNLIIGKKADADAGLQHLIYNDKHLKVMPNTLCGTDDSMLDATTNEELVQDRATGDCTGLWVELDKDVAAAKGSVANASSWITGVFSQVITLYANEQLEVNIEHLQVWPAGNTNQYKGNSSSAVLSKFQQGRASSFTGDLAILCNMKSSMGGIAAGFAGICNSTRSASMCFAGLQASYNNVPTYSWTVEVCTHELGHLFGSRHTHACVWNGNNTAIDGCYTTEGGCASPGLPSGGGTIMSYCHLTSAGINFNNGFGPQPGAKIRTSIQNATCLSANCTTSKPSGARNAVVGTLQLSPNPVSDQALQLTFDIAESSEGTIAITDMYGRVVLVKNLGALPVGEQTVFLDVTNLAFGYYVIQLQTATGRISEPFVKSAQ